MPYDGVLPKLPDFPPIVDDGDGGGRRFSIKYYELVFKRPRRCGLFGFARAFARYRHIGDMERGKVRVSAIFMPHDMDPWSRRPKLFESMIFGGAHDHDQFRYWTYGEAFSHFRKLCHREFHEWPKYTRVYKFRPRKTRLKRR